MDYAAKFESGLDYQSFLKSYGTEQQRQKWEAIHQQIQLTADQTELLTSFVRDMKVMVLAGTWCGDCVNQCPLFDHFSAASSHIQIRFFDRDDNPDLAQQLMTCGAARVPSVLFLSEDNFVCGRYGDRTLSKYRDMVQALSGAACPTGIGGVESTLMNNVVQEWLNEFERIQLMLRTSGRLRALHGD